MPQHNAHRRRAIILQTALTLVGLAVLLDLLISSALPGQP